MPRWIVFFSSKMKMKEKDEDEDSFLARNAAVSSFFGFVVFPSVARWNWALGIIGSL
jgi:hypothetical protein